MPSNPPPSATYFPLRWESTGDMWWYASPIDCAAANGHYDLVRELLRLDPNHMISLTSLRRLRRLESVWDDAGDGQFVSAARSRSDVARRLFHDSAISAGAGVQDSTGTKRNPLIEAGYGGWLLYTAASAGDLGFVNELVSIDPLLVFGEGEYGLTDMLYAAARSMSPEVFWVLYDLAVSPRFERTEKNAGEVACEFKWEVLNRAVHAAARGGNAAVLAELLGGGDGVLTYRDAYGSTVLHAAASRGQVEVVKYLITTFDDIISSTDKEGNTALHVAAYEGQLSVVETLLRASPSLVSATNNDGNTLLHMSVAGALSLGFQRVDRQIELMNQLSSPKNNFNIEDVINTKNNQGRTALHAAIIGNVHSDLVQHLMAARYIHVSLRDNHGMTPLDYLRQQPRSSSSEMLIRKLISAGGVSNCQDYSARKTIAQHLKLQGSMCSSPGTSFRILDSEIFKYSGIEHAILGSSKDHRGVPFHHFSSPSEVSECGSNFGEEEQVDAESKKRKGRVQNATKRLKTMFRWFSMKKKGTASEDDDGSYAESHKRLGCFDEPPVPLRERFLGPTSLANNKRTLAVRSGVSSPTTSRKKFAGEAAQSAVMDFPDANGHHSSTSTISVSKMSMSSHSSSLDINEKKPMDRHLRIGGSGLSVARHLSKEKEQPIKPVACH